MSQKDKTCETCKWLVRYVYKDHECCKDPNPVSKKLTDFCSYWEPRTLNEVIQ